MTATDQDFRRIKAGYTQHPESVACYATDCGHAVCGHLERCKRSELGVRRKPRLGDITEQSDDTHCVHFITEDKE